MKGGGLGLSLMSGMQATHQRPRLRACPRVSRAPWMAVQGASGVSSPWQSVRDLDVRWVGSRDRVLSPPS